MSAVELVYGRHAVSALVESDLAGVLELWLLDGRDDELTRDLEAKAMAAGVHVQRMPRRTLDRKLDGARHQGVAARYRPSGAGAGGVLNVALEDLTEGVSENSLVLALDGVDDPRNLGACLRSAAAAGASAVIAPRSRGASVTPAARKAAAGGAEVVPFVAVANLARALTQLGEAGFNRVGTAADAPGTLWQADLRGPLVLVLGGEHQGLRRLTREHCDLLVRIPMAGARGAAAVADGLVVESLNVSVAAGVCLFESLRQRG